MRLCPDYCLGQSRSVWFSTVQILRPAPSKDIKMKPGFASILALGGLLASVAEAHVAITYPGWRGNNIVSNDTFPFGMQWLYPCESSRMFASPLS